jgi:hypothetical protein
MRLSPTHLLRASVGAATAVALLAGCPDREVSKVVPSQDKAELKDIPVEVNRKVDILFVVDNSSSMREEQTNLSQNFPRFIEALSQIEGGLPDVHIGVISTDLGAGNFPGASDCQTNDGEGEDGYLIVRSECAGRLTTGDNFLTAVQVGDQLEGTNFTGGTVADLSATFQCMAELGDDGCGFEQPLEATRRALDGRNEGFLRPEAFLAIVILTDEDDCSANDDESLFATNNDSLGPRTSFRCFEYGITCDESGRATGPRTNCKSNESGEYLQPIQQYIEDIKALKADPKQVIVAGIIGLNARTQLPEPVAVGTTPRTSNPELLEVCRTTGTGSADPGIRLKTFFDAFPERNTTVTICDEDLSASLTVIGQLLAKVIGNPCLTGDLKDFDPDPSREVYDCAVSDVTNLGADNETQTPIGSCASRNNMPPCWRIETDPETCTLAPNLKITIDRGSQAPPSGTVQRIQCVVGDDAT